MMYCVCPVITLALCSQLAATQSSTQLIPAHSVWSGLMCQRIGFIKYRCVFAAPKMHHLEEAAVLKEPLKCNFTAAQTKQFCFQARQY